jgi:hypothetical protein
MSFSTSASIVVKMLMQSQVFPLVQGALEHSAPRIGSLLPGALQLFSAASGAMSGGTSASLDCLQDGDGPPTLTRRLQVPIALYALSILAIMARQLLLVCASTEPAPRIEEALVKVTVVFVSVFLPAIVVAITMAMPCARTQTDGLPKHAWDLSKPCSHNEGVVLLSVLVCAILGPGAWAVLIIKEKMLPPRTLRFLTSGYKPKKKLWEVGVLSRRCCIEAIAIVAPLTYATLTHAFLALGVMVLAWGAHASNWPYEESSPNKLEFSSLFTSVFSMLLAMYAVSSAWSQSLVYNVIAFCLSVVLLIGNGCALLISLLRAVLQNRTHASQ